MKWMHRKYKEYQYIFESTIWLFFFFNQKALIHILWSVAWGSRHMIPIKVNDPRWL